MANQESVNENENYDYYLTTKDNPYDPKTQFEEWYVYDLMLGYSTLQRLAKMEDYLAVKLKIENESSLHNTAIAEMLRLDPLEVYQIRKYKSEPQEYVTATEEQKKLVELAKEL